VASSSQLGQQIRLLKQLIADRLAVRKLAPREMDKRGIESLLVGSVVGEGS